MAYFVKSVSRTAQQLARRLATALSLFLPQFLSYFNRGNKNKSGLNIFPRLFFFARIPIDQFNE